MTELKIEYVDINSLTPYENNARKHADFDVGVIAKSIEEFGMNDPIGVWGKNNIIVEGHGRLLALKQLGYTEVPIIRLDHLNDEQRKAYALTHNRSAELSIWDDETLMNELDELDSKFNLDELGFSEFLIGLEDEEEEHDIHDDDYNYELKNETVSKLGDIFILGKHRLMCGDSRNIDDVKKLVDDRIITCVFTDPPWNVDYGGTSHPSWRKRSILNDKMSPEDFNLFLMKAFTYLKEVIQPGAMMYCVMSAQEWGNIMDVLTTEKYHWSSTIIWAKDSLVLSRKDYHTQYEPIWYGWYAGNDNAPRLCPLKDRKQSDLWDIPRPKVSELHPTTKPVPLVTRALQNSSHPGDTVCDLFGGSGTTLIAAEETDRNCVMMELDPRYVDVIVKRYIHFTGSGDGCRLIRNGVEQDLPKELIEPSLLTDKID